MIITIERRTGVLLFDDDATLLTALRLLKIQTYARLSLSPVRWNTVFVIEDGDATIFEIKEDPFNPDDTTEFAQWSPKESSANALQLPTWAKLLQLAAINISFKIAFLNLSSK